MNYVTAKEAKNILKINATTLKSWKDKGILSYKKLSDKKILYDIDSVLNNSDNLFFLCDYKLLNATRYTWLYCLI